MRVDESSSHSFMRAHNHRVRPGTFQLLLPAFVRVQDKQDFELKAFDLAKKGKPVFTLKQKGVGPFGVPGRVSATIQAGRPILLTVKELGF